MNDSPVAGTGPEDAGSDRPPDLRTEQPVDQESVSRSADPARVGEGRLNPAALLAEIDALPPDVYAALKRCWPDGVPTPKQVAAGKAEATGLWLMTAAAAVRQAKDACLYLTPAELAARQAKVDEQFQERFGRSSDGIVAERRLGAGHRRVGAAGGKADAGSRPMVDADDGHRRQGLHDEAGAADPAAIDALTRNLAALTNPQQNIIKTWLAEAKDAGVFFGNLKGNPTVRRFALARACWALVSHMDGDDELVRLALAFVAGGDAVQPAFPTGAVIGALTPEQADRLYEVASGYAAGTVVWTAGRLAEEVA